MISMISMTGTIATTAMMAPAGPAVSGDAHGVLADIGHLAPMMIVAFWALLTLSADAFAGPGVRRFEKHLALGGLGLAFLLGLRQFGGYIYDPGVPVFSGFLVVDQFSLLFDIAIIAVAAAVIAFANDYARAHRFEYGEQETLVLIAAFGMMTLVHAGNLLAIFLGIETMSIAVYVLVGARWNSGRSAEAALKYFLMGAFSSGLLLMGIALVYGATGTLGLSELGSGVSGVFTKWGAAQPYVDVITDPAGAPLDALKAATDKAVTGMAPAALFIPGVLLVLTALLFKVSAVPFHMWTPDAYDGAPTPVTAFMAAGVKIGAVAALLKVMVGVFSTQRLVTAHYGWTSALVAVALLTMTIGNFAAVRQTNVKRLLAYSSVAHVGYLLVGVLAAANYYGHAYQPTTLKPADQVLWARTTGDLAVASVTFYVLVYAVATLGAFACVAWFSGEKKEATSTHEWSGLAQRHPMMALGMTVCLLSLMGMPPTAGFLGKLFLFRSAFENDQFWLRFLVVAALLNAVVGAYYYLRLVVAMYFRPPPDRAIAKLPESGARIVVGLAAILSVAFGIGADFVMRRAELAASGFVFPAGSTAKGEWVDRLRARWEQDDIDAEAARVAADAAGAAAAEAPGPVVDPSAPIAAPQAYDGPTAAPRL